jgi:ABC-type dipeptide/oligopeptide/nickel transport system permease subunit
VNLMIAVGVSAAPDYARLVRGSTLSIRNHPFVEAGRALGGSDLRLIARHVLPNILSPVIVMATLGLASAILVASALSFLGFGASPPSPEWGVMLNEGRQLLTRAWWLSTFPGLAIMLTVMGCNLLGDGIRDLTDPRTR